MEVNGTRNCLVTDILTARKMERNWKKTKIKVFRIAWKASSILYREALKAARSAYFSTLLEENNTTLGIYLKQWQN